MATETITIPRETVTIDTEVIDNVNKVEEEKKTASSLQKITEAGTVNLQNLSPTEVEECKKLTKSLSTKDINSITNYGCELQSTMSKYSNNFLTSVRSTKANGIGELVTDLLGQLDEIDLDDLKEPNALVKFVRKVPIIRHMVTSVNKIMNKYDTIARNVDSIAKRIEVTRLTSLRDNTALQTIFDSNVAYGKQVDKLIIAANYKLEESKKVLEDMKAHSEDYEAYQINDVENWNNSLEHKISDLVTMRYVIKQSLPQIRVIQNNNIMIANKAQTIVSTTLPLWRNQLSLAVALQNQSSNLEAHRKVSEMTNELLRRNAEMIHSNSTKAAEQNEKSIIELETLKHTTSELIDTIKEVKQIHEEGIARRKETEREILRMTDELDVNLRQTQNLLPSMHDDIMRLSGYSE